MMEFAQLLTATRIDIKVTIVNNKYNHDLLQQRMLSMAAAADVDSQIGTADVNAQTDTIGEVPVRVKPHDDAEKLHLTWVDNGLPLDFDYTDLTGSKGMELYLSTIHMKEPFEQTLRTLHSKRPTVSCVLFGFLCSWVQPVAAELGIPTLLFCAQSASVFSIYHNIPLLIANGFFPYNKKDLPGCNDNQAATSDLVTYMPGLLPLHPSSFPTFLRVDNISESPVWSNVIEEASLMGKAYGVIINSFEELEKEAWQAIQRELPHSAFLVGILLKLQDDGKVESEDVEKVVRMLFHEEEGLRMRERASILQAAARQARQAQGSSSAQIEKFVQGLQKSNPTCTNS